MRRISLTGFLIFIAFSTFGQREFHVFPADHPQRPGKAIASGSLEDPWDLATALSQTPEVVNGGDIIYLHEGIYNGRFISKLHSNYSDKHIIVMPYEEQKVILNGNVESRGTAVLEVRGGNVTYRDFEVTFLGDFPRRVGEPNFKVVDGIEHLSGEDCQFLNIKIHNVPGSGFGTWKETGGTTIAYCKIYNNGYFSKARGSGVGLYVQNQSKKQRKIHNNLVFNNFYKGIQVWSASSGGGREFIKNISIERNVVFNNGLPANVHVDNLIVASGDKTGFNRPKNILIKNNVFFHNTNFEQGRNYGDGKSVTIGYKPQAPVENVIFEDNIIVGKNNAIRFFYANSLEFRRNMVYCGYVHFNKAVIQQIKSGDFDFDENIYYTRKTKSFRVSKYKDYTLDEWRESMKLDKNSDRYSLTELNLKPILYFSERANHSNKYELVVFKKGGGELEIDLKEFQISGDGNFKLLDIETNEVIHSGKVKNGKLTINMDKRNGTTVDFGVYSLEIIKSKKGKGGFFKRFFSWLF